jgi:glycine cleavage system H protein
MYPAKLKYSKSHEWVRVEGNRGVVGITDYAANELGDVTYVELPEAGVSAIRGDSFGVVESIKAVEDLLSPVSGQIVETNNSLVSTPETINRDPYGEGWLIALELEDVSELQELMTAEQYETFVEEGGE